RWEGGPAPSQRTRALNVNNTDPAPYNGMDTSPHQRSSITGMAEQYIFTIEGLSKAYGKREVLKNIWLAFYPGAKIGVIGSNGSGKSTLLRIMALQDKDFLGTARLTPGFTIGYVPQEPKLDDTKTVLGNIEEAVA